MRSRQPTGSADGWPGRRRLTRREVLLAGTGVLGAAGVGVLAAGPGAAATPIGPHSGQVRAVDAGRVRSGRTVELTRTAQVADVHLGGGQAASTWVYDGQLPGPEIRVRRGDVLRLRLANQLPDPTGIHWHGLAIRNDMDGVPGVTMPLVSPGAGFGYDFVVPDAGTYWYHSHVGLQLDRGLYGALIVEDPNEPSPYDRDTTLIFDDWLDGIGQTPQSVYDTLRRTGMTAMGSAGMTAMGSAGMSGSAAGAVPSSLGGDAGDVRYPLLLVNGKNPADPSLVIARPGQRLRLRLVNAGADTAFRVAVGGHRLTVTGADGFPVRPVVVDTLLIGMGERYDVLVTAGDGVFPIVGYAEGKGGTALAVLQTSSGARPPAGVLPRELTGRMLAYTDLQPAAGTGLAERPAASTLPVALSFDGNGYRWMINGRTFDNSKPLRVRSDQRVQLSFRNNTMMFHPMHLHGHTFALNPPAGPGTRKDTVIIKPMQTVTVELDAANPGQWVLHCHNAYHQEGGMMTTLSYVA